MNSSGPFVTGYPQSITVPAGVMGYGVGAITHVPRYLRLADFIAPLPICAHRPAPVPHRFAISLPSPSLPATCSSGSCSFLGVPPRPPFSLRSLAYVYTDTEYEIYKTSEARTGVWGGTPGGKGSFGIRRGITSYFLYIYCILGIRIYFSCSSQSLPIWTEQMPKPYFKVFLSLSLRFPGHPASSCLRITVNGAVRAFVARRVVSSAHTAWQLSHWNECSQSFSISPRRLLLLHEW